MVRNHLRSLGVLHGNRGKAGLGALSAVATLGRWRPLPIYGPIVPIRWATCDHEAT